MGFEMLFLMAVAHGYDLNDNTWTWEDDPVEDGFQLNVQSFNTMDPAAVGAAWSLALDVWNAEGSAPIYLPNFGTTDITLFGDHSDGHNVTMYAASTFATSLASARYNSIGDEMTNCDIRIYGNNLYGDITWSTHPDGAVSGEYDLTHTVVHETGHCIGFSHSEYEDAIMYSSNGSGTGWERRHLHPDDVAGLQAMYGQGQLDLVEDGLTLTDENGDGVGQPGELIEVALVLRNAGNAPAVDVMGVLVGGGNVLQIDTSIAEIGDLPHGRSVGTDADAMGFSLSISADCADTTEATAEVQVTDWFGDVLTVPVNIPLDCAGPGTTGTTPNGGTLEDPNAKGCGCDHSGPAPWAAIALLLPVFLRRRTG